MRNQPVGQLIKEVLAHNRTCMFANLCNTSLIHTLTRFLFNVHFNIIFFSNRSLSIPIYIRLS